MNHPECPRHFEIIKESNSYISVKKINHRGVWTLDVPVCFWARFVKDKEWQSHMESKYSVLTSMAEPSRPLPKWWPKTKPSSMSKSGIIPTDEPTAISPFWNLPVGWCKDKETASFVTLSARAWEYERSGVGVIELNIPSALWKRFCKDEHWREDMTTRHAKLRYLRSGGDDGVDIPAPEWHKNRIGEIPLDEPFAFSQNWNCPKGFIKLGEDSFFVHLKYTEKSLSKKNNGNKRNLIESIKEVSVPIFIWKRFTQDFGFRKLVLDEFSLGFIEKRHLVDKPLIENYNSILSDVKFNSLYWNLPFSHKVIEETPSFICIRYDYYDLGKSGFQELFSELKLKIPVHHWDRYCSDESWRMNAIKKHAKLLKLNVARENYWKAMQESDESGVIPNNPSLDGNPNWKSITFS